MRVSGIDKAINNCENMIMFTEKYEYGHNYLVYFMEIGGVYIDTG